jgi:enoyl-CoA hydratase / 3-hydroxyacyl-CoA dehydrogenase
MTNNRLYPSYQNPYLLAADRPLPEEMAVVGAGHIGPDIAYFLRTGLPDKKLYLVDVSEEPLKKAEERYKAYAAKGVKMKKMTQEMADKVLGNIVYTTDYNALASCDLVIEAATENLGLKKKIFNTLEEVTSEKAILTSNTSGIPAHEIFNSMKHPERCTITHFFAPAWRSLPVEVINWEGASDDLVNYLLWFFANTGKVPMVTDNVPSFLLNRIFENWCNEAVYLLDKATTYQIDHVCEEITGSGPFFVLNLAGGNPLIHESQTRLISERECYKPSMLFQSVNSWNTNRIGTKIDVPLDLRDWIRDRMLGCVFSQCFDIADRTIGTRQDLNLGCIIGLAFKKGPFEMMENLGEREVMRIVEAYNKERPGWPQPKREIAAYTDFHRDFLVDDMDGVRIITIRRPQAANSLGVGTCDEILAELQKGETDPSVKGFVITGYGTKAFCAGADINGFVATIDDYSAGMALARGNSKLIEYINTMNKPVVAAINGLAMGGGVEVAIACHSMVAVKNAFLQLPEITLGIFPGMGGAILPYRKWPQAAEKLHAMIGQNERLTCKEGLDLGIIAEEASNYQEMIQAAIGQVNKLANNVPRIADSPVSIPAFTVPDNPMAGKLPVSKEALTIAGKVINEGAAAESFKDALEISYHYSGVISCIDAPKEGVFAFLEKRKPNYTK